MTREVNERRNTAVADLQIVNVQLPAERDAGDGVSFAPDSARAVAIYQIVSVLYPPFRLQPVVASSRTDCSS